MPTTTAETPRPTARLAAGLLALGLGLALASPRAATAADLPRLATEVAFPNLRFDRPVVLAYPDDGSHLLFVVEQHQKKIYSFPNERETKDKRLFLDLPDPIQYGNEEGLLGLAFHPKYKENGQFFVYYSSAEGPTGRRSVVSRFRVSKDDPRKADPKSEERVWVSAPDPYENHNGGCILFGPDGYLYITLGDSGAADDPLTTGQNPRDWFGSILRIDVDHPEGGNAYGIPKDNPARRSPEYKHWAPEVYAIGLRNVWKFSFDRQTGTLWAGDVGQNLWEMVHIIKNGGNYGWSIREGFHPFQPQRRQKPDPAAPISKPIVEYPHAANQDPSRPDTGLSITGGYVFRGKALPSLVGVYVYGDFDSGRIWGLREKDGKAVENRELIDVTRGPKLNIAAFGEDPAGELYILAFDGKIYRLVPRP
jgi:glucose/arabinose dehydrogenase